MRAAISLSFVEPYLLDYRVALGLDLYQRQQLSNSYISYGTKTLGFSPRLGFALREDLSLQLRYSIYQQEITLPSYLANCNNDHSDFARRSTRRPALTSMATAAPAILTAIDGRYRLLLRDGEASLPVRKELPAARP